MTPFDLLKHCLGRTRLASFVGLAVLTGFAAQAQAEGVPATLGAGYSHTCTRKADGTLWCWGANDSGQLGNNTTGASSVPLQVMALGNQVAQVSLGDLYTCAIKVDKTLWCWGNNVAGQLGDGLTDNSLVPVQNTAIGNDVAEVSAGDLLTCARKGNGTVWCWGAGYLGDGTYGQRTTPGQVTALGNTVAQVSTGGSSVCARKADGTLWCWGDNEFGIIGDGTTVERLTPVQVATLGNTVAEVSVGDVFACARKTDGNVWCWGTNDHGQLGDGSTSDHFTPAVIIGLGKPAIQISANGRHACALRNDNQLGCWGSNFNGEVGDGTIIDRPLPEKVSVLPNNVVEVSAGVNHTTCARMADGRVACWGLNSAGQLGDGTTVERRVPVQAIGPYAQAVPVPAGGGWISAALAFLLLAIARSSLRRAGGVPALPSLTVIAVVAASLGLGACARDPLGAEAEESGSVGVALTAAPGITFATASYTITGPGSFAKTASVDISKSGSLSFTGTGIPAGSGYTIVVKASGAGKACSGSAGFAVVAHTTTNVMVNLSCDEPPRTGSVTFNGALNVCPRLTGLNSSPAQAAVGKGVAIGANWADPDGGPSPLTFKWTATSGTFDNAASAATKFVCLSVGTATLTLTVSDGDPAPACAATASIQVNCLDPLVAQCSFPLRANGTACNDNNACTQSDTCQAGTCTGAAPVTCTALDQCHVAGVCDPNSGICSNPNQANGSACSDSNACTQTDSCQSGACIGANPITCTALDQCHTAGTCVPATGICSNPNKANGTACNDGNLCTSTDACQAGSCAGAAVVCAAGADACHPGVCDPGNGTCSNPNACNLYGVGSLSATGSDGVVGDKLLEDGTPHNRVGALGSAITYTGAGDKYVVTPDCGPNAGLSSYDERYYLLNLSLANGLVTPSITGGATLNKSAGVTFNGHSSLFDATNSPNSRRFDSEAVRVTPAGTFWVSDEYGPFLSEFSATGDRLRFITLPSKFLISNPASGDAELPPVNTSGRVVNRGMEGLAISPDGHRLYGLMQNGIMQDGELNASNQRVGTHNRIVEFDADTGVPLREFLYILDNKDYGCNELLAVNDHQFLVIERDGAAGTAAAFKKLMLIDINGATDISGMASLSPNTGSVPGVTPVSKQPFLDLLSPTYGLAGATFPEKIEGLAFGPDQPDGRRVLVVTNDNDFLVSNPNNFYVFFISPTALPGFQSQQATFSTLCANVTCPAPADACDLQGTCNPGTGLCSTPPVAAGTAVGTQTPGDCQKLQCDGAGNQVSVADNADVPSNSNQCNQGTCSGGSPVFMAAPINTACNQNGGSYCNGAGACVGCNSPSQCSGTDDECKTRTCNAGACGMAFAPSGQPLTTQTAGNCQQLQCDGTGTSTSAIDNGDVPVDGNQCTTDVCTAGVPANPPTAIGSTCSGGTCDGEGVCTGGGGCLGPMDCPGTDTTCSFRTCTMGACGMAFAPNGTLSGSQTTGDCMKNMCNGAGSQVSAVDTGDVPNDGTQCTSDQCSGAGVPSNPPVTANTSCSQNDGNVCDGAGACVPTVRVVRLGAGAAALSNASTAVFIEERHLDGNLVATLNMPVAASGPNQPLTMSGSASSEGALTLSTDGHALALAGYATAPGLASVASTASTAVQRVVGRIDATGAINTSTVLGTNFSANNVRGALANATGLWVAGAAGGIYFAPLGSTTGGTLISSTSTNNRTISAWGGQLYGSSNSGSFNNVFTVGSGLPTSGSQTAVLLPGMPATGSQSPFAFAILDRNPAVAGVDTMYLADDRAAASGGGVQKWTLATDGGNWTLAGTLNVTTTPIGFRGVTGFVTGGTTIKLIGTTTDTLTRLVVFTDTGLTTPSATSSVISTSATNTVYRGVAMSPQP